MPWSNPTVAFASLIVLASAFLTGVAFWYGHRNDLKDQPGERRAHALPTVRGGGIAIVVSTVFTLLVLRNHTNELPYWGFALGFGAVALVGWIDDHRPLSVKLRLAIHVVAALVFAVSLASVVQAPQLQLVIIVLTFVLCVVLTNVWNFMDGINGIATTTAIVALAIPSLSGSTLWGPLALGMGAACFGFLPWNFPRARIFMGDVGSGALGFAVAAGLSATVVWMPVPANESGIWWGLARNVAIVLMPIGPFLVDAIFTLAVRMYRRERWWQAHSQHAFQAAARRLGHVRVTVAYTLLALIGLGLSILVSFCEGMIAICSSFVWYICLVIFWLCARRRFAD